MKLLQRGILIFLLLLLTTSCAKTKALEVWQDEDYSQSLGKIMIIAAARQDFVRNMFENVMAADLKKHGLQAVPSHEVLPPFGDTFNAEMVLAKARELGVESIMLVRSLSKEALVNYQPGRPRYGWVYVADENSTFYGRGFMTSTDRYDSVLLNVLTNIYNVDSENVIWLSLSEVWVDGTKEGAVRPFSAALVKQLEKSKMIR